MRESIEQVALSVLLLVCAFSVRLAAQDPFEIVVYPAATHARGEWELETHLNYIARGTTAFDGRVAPTQKQTHLAFELTTRDHHLVGSLGVRPERLPARCRCTICRVAVPLASKRTTTLEPAT